MSITRVISAASAIALIGIVFFFWSGWFNISADTKHWAVTEWVLEAIRERSIEHASDKITVPGNLDEQSYYAQGAGNYQAMCSSCHLAPGKTDSELRMGLYPKPPAFTETRPANPGQTFWVVKHGLKMTGMPAWGKSHSDESIWQLVGFLRQLPDMDESTYLKLVEQYGGSHSHDDGNHHENGMHSGSNEQADNMSEPDATPSGQDNQSEQGENGHDHHGHTH